MTDYLPSTDGSFNIWANQFITTIKQDPTAYDVPTESLSQLETLLSAWDANYFAAQAKKDEAKAAVTGKDETRSDLEEQIRSVAQMIQANKEVTNESRQEAGLPIRSSSRAPINAPTTFPVAFMETPAKLEHVIRVFDSATPNKRAKPSTTIGFEIHQFIGEGHPPTDEAFRFIGMSSKSTTTITFPADNASLHAFYKFRWVTRKGETSPWSDTISGMIVN